jgi:NitT/TauT family transport system substrate-binding protein
MEQAIKPFENGFNAKIVTGNHSGCVKILVNQDSGINSLADLKNKRVGVHSFTAGSYMFAVRAIADAGIKVGTADSEVDFVVMPNSELPLALVKGAVDAAAVFDPVGPKALQDFPFKTIADLSTLEPYASQVCCVSIMSASFVEAHPEAAARFAIALQKAAQWISEGNEEELGRIMFEKNYVPTSPEINTAILKSYRHDIGIYSIHKVYESFGISVRALQALGLVSKNVRAETLQKDSFAFLKGVK